MSSSENNTNFVQLHGITLHQLGYPIIPIRPRDKIPAIDAWQKIAVTDNLVNRWASAPACGVGIRTGEVVGLDIDCDDAGLVDDMVAYCELVCGEAPVRGGYGSRILLVYRTDTPRKKRMSAGYLNLDDPDRPHRVEVLGAGQQFVAYGYHRDTGEPYAWSGDPPAVVDLCAINDDQVGAVIDHFETLCVQRGLVSLGGDNRRVSPVSGAGDPLAMVKPPLDISDDHIALLLTALQRDREPYADWLRVGMALHHQFQGGDNGLKTWHVWSEPSPKYDAKALDTRWAGFHNVRDDEVVTFASLKKRASIQLMGDDPLAEALEHYAYIAEGDGVADLRQLPHHGLHKINEFRNLLANVRVKVATTDTKGKPVAKKVAVSALWLQDPLRKTAARRLYIPGEPRLFVADEVTAYNTFAFPRHEQAPGGVNIGVFLTHVEYLFPRAVEREWFLDWLAHAVQRPEERPQVTPLHISREHGTGRGLLVKTMHLAFGAWNCKKTTIKELVGGDFAEYNDYLYESLFVFIEEARENGKAQYEVSDKVRDKLTEDMLPINVKRGYKGTARVFCRVFMMSNHFDALRVPPEDRRINAFDGPESPQDADYYARYLAWLGQPGVGAALFAWLQARDIRGFCHQRSMDTPARRRMIDYGRNETETAFFELLAAPPRAVMTYRQVCDTLDNWDGLDPLGAGISHKQVLRLLQEQCKRYDQIKIAGRRERPWNLAPKTTHSNNEIRAIMTGEKREKGTRVVTLKTSIDPT